MLKLVQSSFEVACRHKGAAYFARGAVSRIRFNGEGADFKVRGSLSYDVKLRVREGGRILWSECTCPYYINGNACKHIWAALLAADKSRIFPQFENAKKISARFGFEIDEEDGGPEAFVKNDVEREPFAHTDWKQKIFDLQNKQKTVPVSPARGREAAQKIIHFAIDLPNSKLEQRIKLSFFTQDFLKNGSMGVLKPAELGHSSLAAFPDAADRSMLQAVLGQTELSTRFSNYSYARAATGASVLASFAGELLQQISDAGRLHLVRRESYYSHKQVHEPYRFMPKMWKLRFKATQKDGAYVISAQLYCEDQERSVQDIIALVDHFVFFEDYLAPSDLDRTADWLELMDAKSELQVPADEINSFLEVFLNTPSAPEMILPPELQITERAGGTPKAILRFSETEYATVFGARLFFDYEGTRIRRDNPTSHVYNSVKREKLQRNLESEAALWGQFETLDPAPPHRKHGRMTIDDGYFSDDTFLPAVQKAIAYGWEVLADDKTIRTGNNFSMEISASGIDWFDVDAKLDFNGAGISLPRLLAQLKEGEQFVRLDDGSYGLLPQAWLRRFKTLNAVAKISPNEVKLTKIQALFIAGSFEQNEQFKGDRKFNSLTQIINDLNTLTPQSAPITFNGKLRAYQRDGLGWLQLLAKHQVGGILADDMGLGKTVQILALLEIFRSSKKKTQPHLLVAPKSLIFNWKNELAKFTPEIKALDFTSPRRHQHRSDLGRYDLILTTYQTLRADIQHLKDFEFESLILDEAHYVKNPKSQAALACRLVKAQKKFALTGTPVENSLNDIFSILAIVNPGLISQSQAQSWVKETDSKALGDLGKALKPFILRRTKDQVLKDLPEKIEQVLFCELAPSERKKYDELKAYYWGQLNNKVQAKGLQKSKIEVLEALLRLRQASCHQGLLDKKLRDQPSSKFQLLLEQISAVIQDGHKVLVFSQFTSLLSLLKPHLEEQNVRYQYLDGQTTDREQRVRDFQNDPELKVFLLSLKAGGVGLNLTAADYVFVLDPWWNPAAESQAIDRAHRIGQKRKVFSYKIIAKDTVEEKILELQARKKDLAKSVISDSKSILKNLTLDDLQALFI